MTATRSDRRRGGRSAIGCGAARPKLRRAQPPARAVTPQARASRRRCRRSRAGRRPTSWAQMIAFKSGKRAGTIMDRIAKGFSDEEIRAIAAWYAAQK